jgi:hypothetical protein
VTEQTKVCTKCGVEKALSEFDKHKLGRLGVHSRCRDCRREESRVAMAAKRADPEGRARMLGMQNNWYRERWKNDAEWRAKERLRINQSNKRRKPAKQKRDTERQAVRYNEDAAYRAYKVEHASTWKEKSRAEYEAYIADIRREELEQQSQIGTYHPEGADDLPPSIVGAANSPPPSQGPTSK